MHAKIGIERDFTYTDLKGNIEKYANQLSLNKVMTMYDQITGSAQKLMQNVNPTLVFEQIVIKGVS